MEAQLMFSFLLILNFTLCSSKDTITMNQTFQDGDLLISRQKEFALGFFSPGSSSNRYLGIWYHKIRGQTVVWVANRNNPINGASGILSINQQGNLVLQSNDNLMWSTNVSVEVNATLTAHLFDSGNLVLIQGRTQRILWQSFDHPTDTALPGMDLGLNRKTGLSKFLTSWRSPDDPATGNYSLRLNPNGSPQFCIYNESKVIWRTGPWPWRNFPHPYNYNFINNGDEIHRIFVPDDSSIQRVMIDVSGFLRWLTWHDTINQWKEFWTSPKDQCDFYGQCGANSKCDYNTLNMFECTCLPGYEPKSPRAWSLRDGSDGCIRKRAESSSICRQGEGFMKVESLVLPDSSTAAWVDMSMSHTNCDKECKKDCSCSAYASIDIPGNGTGCLAWYGELIDTKNNIGVVAGYDLYVRVDALELAESVTKSSSFLERKGMIGVVILSVASAWLLFVYFWLRMRKKKRRMKKRSSKRRSVSIRGLNYHFNKSKAANETEGGGSSDPDIIIFNLNTILAATDNFSAANKIGEGGFGTVYKGQLSNGEEIAVKRMSEKTRQGTEEFKNEAILIGKLQHRNLVKLLGCCIQKKEQILVYEYLPNKSLDFFLFKETRRELLDWGQRFNIIVEIARGILYLHQDSRLRIIHRDLKSSNILLDAEMNPKISDFGMARLLQNDQVQGKTSRVVGTYGYMSPEYAVFGNFSVKSDVFSFGVVLFEIISGRKSNGFNQKDPSLSLIGQVWELWSKDRALEIVHSSLKETCKYEEAMRCIQVGLLCVQEDAIDRPTMLEVILMLKSETPLPPPKQPAFIFKASSRNTNSKEEEEVSCSINQVVVEIMFETSGLLHTEENTDSNVTKVVSFFLAIVFRPKMK